MMVDKEKRQQILSEAIQSFASTPRYNFLRALQVGRFLSPDEDGVGVVSELTFEKLVELGSTKIAKLRWLSEPQEERLIALLKALSEENFETSPVEGLVHPPPRPSPLSANYTPEDEEGLSSAEVENRLRELLAKLASHPQFKVVANRSLGSFWNTEWPRAPFEEALSLEQLSEMDLALLWKKRTTTSRRIDRMARAVQAALDLIELNGSFEEKEKDFPAIEKSAAFEPKKLSVVSPSIRPSRSILEVAATRHPWVTAACEMPTLERVGLRKMIEVCLQPEVRQDAFGLLVTSMLETLSLQDFLDVLAEDWELKRATPSIKLWAALPEVNEHAVTLRLALQGPGVHISSLKSVSAIFHLEQEVGEVVLTAIIKMLGASEVTVKGERCPKVFSLNPKLLEIALSGIGQVDRKNVTRSLSQNFPNLDSELFNWLLLRFDVEQNKAPKAKGKKLPPEG